MSDKEEADVETENLMNGLKGLVIGASGNIPGYQHRQIKKMVEDCGATYAHMDVSKCTHLVTTQSGITQGFLKVDRAIASGDCHIVDVNWLVKSIEKRTPEDVQQYMLLQGKKPVDVINLKCKKRACGTDPDDEDTGLSKKSKDEEKIRFAKLAALVDSHREGSHELSVWMDDAGDIWDATLIENITRVERPKSSRMTFITRLQLIFDSKSKESKKYHVFEVRREISTVSGEQCDSVEKQEGAQMTLNHARCFFEYRFRSHSGLPWENRHGIPKDDRSAFVELQYEEPLILVGENRAFADSVETALRLIFQRGDLDRFVKSMSGYGRRMDLAGQFNGHTLQAAIAILRKIVGLHGHFAEKACGPQINHLCDLYTVLMMVGAENLTYTQGNLAPIMGELNTLDLAIKLHTASRILKTNRKLNTPMTMRQISHALGLAKLTPVDVNSEEYKELCIYLHGSARKSHASQFKLVLGLFRLERPGEMERFTQWEKQNESKIGDRRLLWHGSSTVNFAGILSQGLRHGGLCSANGKTFCRGIFFADMSTKSLGYCQGQGEALISLCEVELGKLDSGLSTTVASSTIHTKWRDAGCIHQDFMGSQIPDVRAPPAQGRPGGLYHPEYIVQNAAQVRLQYLFHVQLQ